MYRLTFSLDIIKDNKREYFGLNILYYGLVTASMVFTYFFPDVQSGLLELIRIGITDAFPWIVEAYQSGNFLLAVVLTFLINFFLGSFLYITLPALIIPFGARARHQGTLERRSSSRSFLPCAAPFQSRRANLRDARAPCR